MSRITYVGRFFVSWEIRPMYSPKTPVLTNRIPLISKIVEIVEEYPCTSMVLFQNWKIEYSEHQHQ